MLVTNQLNGTTHVSNQPAERTTHVSKAVKITSPSRGQQVPIVGTVSEMPSNNKYQQ